MRKNSFIWSYAVGLAFFAFSLGIVLPFSIALASSQNGSNSALMEICSIGGIRLSAPASTTDVDAKFVSHGHEFCIYCGLSNGPLISADPLQNNVFFVGAAQNSRSIMSKLQSRHRQDTDKIRGPPS